MVSLIGLADILEQNWISNHHCLNPLETSAKESTESDMLWLGLSANIYGCFSFDFDKNHNCGYQWKYKQEKTWEGTLSSKF